VDCGAGTKAPPGVPLRATRFSACHAFCPSLLIISICYAALCDKSASAFTQPTVLARSCPAAFVLRGNSGGRPSPIVCARLVPRRLPRTPTRLLGRAKATTDSLLHHKYIRLDSEQSVSECMAVFETQSQVAGVRPRKPQGYATPAQNKISTFRQSLVPRFFLQVVFCFGSPCTFPADPLCVGPMFKYFFRVPFGGWWLLVGVAPRGWSGFSFHLGFPQRYRREVFRLRAFRLEVCIARLPF